MHMLQEAHVMCRDTYMQYILPLSLKLEINVHSWYQNVPSSPENKNVILS